ncbi:methionyl-tRNA synthetase [Xylariaceae sp. FL1651]|nr:methionyl-tRNA synthetase [Xylariaceae sp. FL1651]
MQSLNSTNMAEDSLIGSTVLPEPGQRNVLVTSALPYVNNIPHLSNIIEPVLSKDIFAKYCRGCSINTLYVGGTDEYGTTTETRALVERCTLIELCDKYCVIYAGVYKWFNISFDIFDIFLRLNKNEFLNERECPVCAYQDARGDQCDLCDLLLDTLQLKNPRCEVDGSAPSTKETNHVFIELDKLQQEVEAFFRESSAEGLEPRSITRHELGNQSPSPGYEDKVIYPWFDACIGYISITTCYTDQWGKWWRNPEDVQLFQFIGKDNVAFHSITFPATQIGTQESWAKLRHLSTTEYLTYEGGKFSKSQNIVYHRPESSDTEFNWDSFINDNNNLLAKNLSNFVNRVLKFVSFRNYDSIMPDWTGYHEASFNTFKDDITKLLMRYIQELNAVNLRSRLSTSNKLDRNLRNNEPSKCAAVIGIAVNLMHLLASLLTPYMPDTANSIYKQLGADPFLIPDCWSADSIKLGHKIGKAEHLFRPIKPEMAQEWRKAFGVDEAKKAKEEETSLKTKRKGALRATRAVKADSSG